MGRLAIPTIAYLWRGSAAARQRRPYDSGLQPTPDLTPAAIEVSGGGQLEPKQGWRRRRPETSIAGFGPDGRPPDLGATTAVARQLASRQGHESPRWPNRPCNRGSSRRFPGRLTPLRKQQVLGSNPSVGSSSPARRTVPRCTMPGSWASPCDRQPCSPQPRAFACPDPRRGTRMRE